MSFDNRKWRKGREAASADTAPNIAALDPESVTAPIAEQGSSGIIVTKGMEEIVIRGYGVGGSGTYILYLAGWCENGPGSLLVKATCTMGSNVVAAAVSLLAPNRDITSQVWREGTWGTLADNIAVATAVAATTVVNGQLTVPTLGFPYIQFFLSTFGTITRAAAIWRMHKMLSHK